MNKLQAKDNTNFFKKCFKSYISIDHRLYIALFLMGICPTIYTTVRVFYLGSLPDSQAYSIAGQMEWVNLMFEVIEEAIILPLFFFMGKKELTRQETINRMKTGLIISTSVYSFFAILVIIFAEPLLKLMAANPEIIAESATYIRLESVANIFGILLKFSLVSLVVIAKDWYIWIITGTKLVLCIICDTFLTSNLPCSAKLGVNGIAYGNMIVNGLLWITVMIILTKAGLNIFNKDKMDFKWMKEFGVKGTISGAESFVRNFAYMFMILRMVNVVSEAGTYWVANGFIWNWLIMPSTQLAELVKQNVSKDKDAIRKYTLGYICISLIIIIVACATVPAWKPFFATVLNQKDPQKVFDCAIILLLFMALYVIQNFIDATFYGLGKIHYMLFESVCTNCTYYVIMFVLYITGIWVPTLTSIVWMFTCGQALDTIISICAYTYLLKKYHIDITDINCKKKNYFVVNKKNLKNCNQSV